MRVAKLRVDRLERADVDLSELKLTHYRLTKSKEQQLRLADDQGDRLLRPSTDVETGKPHSPEKKRLSEIIDALNSLFGAATTGEDQPHFAQRICRQNQTPR